jgi:toxin ParE1/3/4
VPETYNLLITRHAENDLAEIYDYIAADSPAGATAFVLQLEEKISTLATLPERASLIPENSLLGMDYRHLIHGRYRIIFRVYGDSVIVLRVIHGNRLLDL